MANGHAPLDITGLEPEDLKVLRDAVDARLSTLEAERREAAFREMEEIARRNGLTKAQVAARFRGRRNGARGPARYRNPDNPAQTWSGRGRRPKWVAAQLERGRSLQDLAVS